MPETRGGGGLLVSESLCIGEPGALVDHGVEEDGPGSLPAFRGSVPVAAAAAAASAPPATSGIRPKFLHIDVDQGHRIWGAWIIEPIRVSGRLTATVQQLNVLHVELSGWIFDRLGASCQEFFILSN